jgi:hypothetical protein
VWRICAEDPRFAEQKEDTAVRVSDDKGGPPSPGLDLGKGGHRGPKRRTSTPVKEDIDPVKEDTAMSPLPKLSSSKHYLTTLQLLKTAADENGASAAFGDLYAVIEKLKQVFEREYQQLPTWKTADYKALERLYRQRPDIEEIALRYQHFLESELPLHMQQGGSPRFFERNFDKFIDRVETRLRSPGAVRPPRGKRYTKATRRFEV